MPIFYKGFITLVAKFKPKTKSVPVSGHRATAIRAASVRSSLTPWRCGYFSALARTIWL